MNTILTNIQDSKINRIKALQIQAASLIQQRKSVKWDKTLRDGYTISINYILNAINRLAEEIEKPTDRNQ